MRTAWLWAAIAALALAGCSPIVNIHPEERERVYVLGSVNQQIMVPYRPDMTILEALSHARFPHRDALKMYVRWVDKSGPIIQTRHFSYSAITKGKAGNEPVHPGDILYFYRNPIYVILDAVERLLQPIGSVFSPAVAATGATAGTTSSGSP